MTTREQLEAAIDAHPDQAENYLVLGDWLQERQDRRGELIALHRAKGREAQTRSTALIRELGPPQPRYGSWQWFYGFVRSVDAIVDEDDQAVVRAMLDHPSLRHLTTLELDLAGGEWDERQWLIDLIAKHPRACWRTLRLNSYWRGGNDPPAGEVDLSAMWAALPRITSVDVAARDIAPGEVRSETLTTLAFDGRVAVEELAALLAGSAPNLRELSLHDVDPERFARALETAPFARSLTKLVLPHASASVQQRILAHCACAQFEPPADGDRYEQTGE